MEKSCRKRPFDSIDNNKKTKLYVREITPNTYWALNASHILLD